MFEVSILYATETNKSLKYATLLSQKLNMPHNIYCFSEFNIQNKNQVLIFVTSTYFDGKPPTNGMSLYDQLQDMKNDFRVEKNYLQNTFYTVFGLGNKEYGSDFNIVARNMNKWVKILGGKQLCNPKYTDEYTDVEISFQKWSSKVMDFISVVNQFYQNGFEDNQIIKFYRKNKKSILLGKYKEIELSKILLDESENHNNTKKELDDLNDDQNSSEEDISDKFDSQLKDIESMDKNMLTPLLTYNLEKQGYGLVGSHSAVKLCRWTKSMLKGNGGCYKYTFYGIISLSCMEITPSLACANKCVFCWRHYTNPVAKSWKWKADDPNFLFNELLEKHQKFIKQILSTPNVDFSKIKDPMKVKHCALSLVGEPILYPRINELIDILHKNKISTFLVTNAQFPEQLLNLKPVTQLYLSIDASNKEDLRNIDRPLHEDFWERFLSCIDILKNRPERTVFRLTVVKEKNMDNFDEYKDLIERGLPDFIEIKGVTFCGYPNKNEMSMKNVPFFTEVLQFSEKLIISGYEIACVHEHSCCVLIAKTIFCIEGRWNAWIDFDKFFEICETENFESLNYSTKTPYWSLVNSEEKGFDPHQKRKFRNRIQK